MVSVKHINLYRTACKLERHCEADQEVDDNTRLVRFMSEVFTFVLETKVREDFTITEETPTETYSWLKAPTGAFTFKTQCHRQMCA